GLPVVLSQEQEVSATTGLNAGGKVGGRLNAGPAGIGKPAVTLRRASSGPFAGAGGLRKGTTGSISAPGSQFAKNSKSATDIAQDSIQSFLNRLPAGVNERAVYREEE
ncbi:MAG: hypothetical protein GY696_40345, partial [Gammaproteobacteria bacterium]|nr:hypothetical protein [Gammaproteobacteria bacterium]